MRWSAGRVLPSFAGLAVLFFFIILWRADQPLYLRLLTLWGIVPFRQPFLDIGGSLAAWDCARRGVDVILADPCDVLRRGYNYSPFWMTIDWLPLGSRDRVWVGIGLDFAFLLSLCALPAAVTKGEVLLRVLAVLSTTVVFALERANPDLLIFIMVVIMLRLPRAGYGLAFFAGLIKYYPFVLLGLALREAPRRFLVVSAFSLAGLVLFFRIYAAGIREGFPHIAGGQPFGDLFGAKNFFLGIFLALRFHGVAAALPMAELASALLLVLVALLCARAWRCGIAAALRRLDEPTRLALVAGALLICGCFLAGQSVAYRGVFLLLLLPGFFALARDREAGGIAAMARAASTGVVLLLWSMALRLWVHLGLVGPEPDTSFVSVIWRFADFSAWLVREVTWWCLVAFLLSLLLAFVVEAPIVQLVARRRWRSAGYGEAFHDRAEQSAFAARRIIAILRPQLKVDSVLDVGCARGTWLAAWAAAGVRDIAGVDGEFVDRENLAIDRRHFIQADLARRFDLRRRFDLVQCLEVAEHLEPQRAESLVADLVTHGDVVLFSAAPPGQGGELHVNERDYDFWRELFAARGFLAYDCLRPALAGMKKIPFWYRYNVILYVRADKFATLPPALQATRAGPAIMDVSPALFRFRKLLLRRLPRRLIDRLARLNALISAAG